MTDKEHETATRRHRPPSPPGRAGALAPPAGSAGSPAAGCCGPTGPMPRVRSRWASPPTSPAPIAPVGQRQLAGRAVHGRADQQGGRHPRPADRALSRRHRFRSEDRGRQRPQADPGAQGRRRAGRHHQRDAPGDQGPDRQPRPHALHLSAALRGPGVHQVPVLHRPDAGAAMRQADPLPDQDARQEALRHAVGQLCLAAAAQQIRPQGDRGQRRRGGVRGVLSARSAGIFRHHRQDPRRQGRLRVQHRHSARPAAVREAALRIRLPEERRRADLRLLRREPAELPSGAGDGGAVQLPRLFPGGR